METTQGEIYFVREQEAGGFSPYTKIGLIKYTEDRDSQSRIGEHQTGNPRPLIVFRFVPTFCVTAAETYMHRKYASYRFHGEWFQLSESQILEAVDFCESLAKRFEREKGVLDTAKKSKDEVSNGETIGTSDEAQRWLNEYWRARFVINRCKSITAIYRQTIRNADEQGEDVSGTAAIQERAPRAVFDEKGFKTKYEDLWIKHVIQKEDIAPPRFKAVEVSEDSLPIDDFQAEFHGLASKMEEALSKEGGNSQVLFDVHEVYLNLLSFEKQAQVDKDIAEAHLKVLCGENDGIQNVCKWTRKLTVKEVLDTKALKSNHPNEYAEFESRGKAVTAVVPKKGIGSA
jgi:hypothetical protein